MNLIQISKSIYKCEFPKDTIVKGAVLINTWLVVNDNKVYIIDTGFEEMTTEILKYANLLGTPTALLATHGHLDHILGVSKIHTKLNIPAYIHPLEITEIRKGITPYPTAIEALGEFFQALTPSVATEAGLRYYTTPGHSPGHVIFYHEEDNILLVGDLFTSTPTQLLPPIVKFTPNMKESIASGKIIDTIKPQLISSSHGVEIAYTEKLYTDMKYFFDTVK